MLTESHTAPGATEENISRQNVPVLEMRGITKRFPGVLALNRVALHLRRGETLALMGENGAGKSTLMKILGGAQLPDDGQIALEGQPVSIPSVAAAKSLGIGLIHQELMLAPNLDVASNIFLGDELRSPRLGLVDQRLMHQEAQRLLQRVGLRISPRALIRSLTTGQMQMIEICRALTRNARILIFDEPTSSLSLQETLRLLQLIADLKKAGTSILYISHRMEEVFRIADRITVLRDGQTVGDLSISEATSSKLVSMMVGRDLTASFPTRKHLPKETVLSVRNMLVPGSTCAVSFEVRRGEILGFAGVVGAGRTELMQSLAGVSPWISGEVLLFSTPYRPKRVSDAIRNGVYLVPEDRKIHGLVLPMSIRQNVSLPDLKNYRPRWLFNIRREVDTAQHAVKNFRIRPANIEAKTLHLSGGNQQKVVLGKWLAMNPRILILDEPTRGIDVGARSEFYERIFELADSGITILLVSSDLEEILKLSDRVIVMRNRKLAATVPHHEINQERIGYLMTCEETAA